MNSGCPLVVISQEEDRWLLQFAETNARCGVILIIVLELIALANILVFGLEENRVLRGQLEFHLKIGFRPRDLIVRSKPIVEQIVLVERETEVAERAVN